MNPYLGLSYTKVHPDPDKDGCVSTSIEMTIYSDPHQTFEARGTGRSVPRAYAFALKDLSEQILKAYPQFDPKESA